MGKASSTRKMRKIKAQLKKKARQKRRVKEVRKQRTR